MDVVSLMGSADCGATHKTNNIFKIFIFLEMRLTMTAGDAFPSAIGSRLITCFAIGRQKFKNSRINYLFNILFHVNNFFLGMRTFRKANVKIDHVGRSNRRMNFPTRTMLS